MNINEQSKAKPQTNGDRLKQMEKRQGLKIPTAFELLQKGGNWLGALREWIKWRVVRGEYITWGSNEPLNVTSKMVEEAASQVAEAAMREAFVLDHHATQDQVRFKQPTELTGIVGLDDDTNAAVGYIDRIGKYDPRPWERVRAKLVRLVRGKPVGPRTAPIELEWDDDPKSARYRYAEFQDRVYCVAEHIGMPTPCTAKWWFKADEKFGKDGEAWVVGRFATVAEARAACVGNATGYAETIKILMHKENLR